MDLEKADAPRNEPCISTILDGQGKRAGRVLVASWTAGDLHQKLEFLALSRTTLTHDAADPSWDRSTKSFLYPPLDRPPPRVSRTRIAQLPDLDTFDIDAFDWCKLWPLYNVLLLSGKTASLIVSASARSTSTRSMLLQRGRV